MSVVASFVTSVRLAKRQGMTKETALECVEYAFSTEVVHNWVPEGYNLVKEPELRGKGLPLRRGGIE